MEAFRSSPRQADLLIVSGRVSHKMAAPLRQIYDQMLEPKWVIAMGACASSGGMLNNYAILQSVDKIIARRHLRPRLPAAPRAADGGDHPAARGDPRRRAARVRAQDRRDVSVWTHVPGLVRVEQGHGETTLVVDPARIVEACMHLRDEDGFDFLSDIAAADYLGWGAVGVSGYIGTAAGRDLNPPMTQGLQVLPEPKEKRFSVSYHLLAVATPPQAGARPGLARRRRADRERGGGLADGRLARARGVGPDGDPRSPATRT